MTTMMWKSAMVAALLSSFGNKPAHSANGDDYWEGLDCNGTVAAIAIHGRNVYIGGKFSAVGGNSANNFAKWDGTNWAALGDGIIGDPLHKSVYSIAASDRFVYAAGSMTNAGGIAVNGVARWNGTNWSPLGSGVRGTVRALAISGESLYVGGLFHIAGGILASNIARWDGTNWHALGDGVSDWLCEFGCLDLGTVRTLAVEKNDLYVGGDFTRVNGMPISGIAKWNGINWSALGSGLPGYTEGIHTLAIQATNLLLGGSMRWVPGKRGPGVAMWNGVTWTAVPQSDFEGARAIVAVGKDIFVGGGVGYAGTNQINGNVSDWDGADWSLLGGGVSGSVAALSSNGSELWVGGSFSQAGGKPAKNLAIWHIPHRLQIQRSTSEVTLAWPASGTNLVLEAKADLTGSDWDQVTEIPTATVDQLIVSRAISGSSEFYRLRRQ